MNKKINKYFSIVNICIFVYLSYIPESELHLPEKHVPVTKMNVDLASLNPTGPTGTVGQTGILATGPQSSLM